jgi:hypothetical protein
MEFHKDGAAALKYQQADGVREVNGTFTAPETVGGAGPYLVQVKVENGSYAFHVDFKGDDLLLSRVPANPEPLTFHKAKLN